MTVPKWLPDKTLNSTQWLFGYFDLKRTLNAKFAIGRCQERYWILE